MRVQINYYSEHRGKALAWGRPYDMDNEVRVWALNSVLQEFVSGNHGLLVFLTVVEWTTDLWTNEAEEFS